MARFIKSFNNDAAIQAAVDNKTLGKPYVALNDATGKIDWNGKDIDYISMPLTFEILSDGDIIWQAHEGESVSKTIQYRKNKGEWTTIVSTLEGAIIPVSAGDNLQFAGNNNTYGVSNDSYYNSFGGTAQFRLVGNIMSLITSTNFDVLTAFTSSNKMAFQKLFYSANGLVDARNLILPKNTVEKCYSLMFTGCSNLTIAPELPAATLTFYCYNNLFTNCLKLNFIKCLVENPSSSNVLNWVYRVSITGTFIKKAGVEWPTGYNGIPEGWTVVEE